MEFGLTISIKKTKVMGQGIVSPPSINIDNVTLDAVDRLTYLGSTIDSNLSLDAEINIRIAKAAAVMPKLNRRVWQNNNLTQMMKLHVYQACVLSTLLYSSEAWTTYTRQEKTVNSFHIRCLRRILDNSWQDKVTNAEVLERASSSSMYTLLSQRRLGWLGQLHRMPNGRIPKYMLNGELVTGTRTASHPYLRYRDTCKRDMKVAGIDTTTWEAAADDRGHWRAVVKAGMRRGEEERSEHEAVKREKRKRKSSHSAYPPQPTIYICHKCGRDCHARVGLINHSRKC